MRSRQIALAVLLMLAAAAPSTASAATISVDRPCYADPSQRQDSVRLTGTGFTPSAQYQVTLDGQPLPGGTGTTDDSGNISGTFVAPELDRGVRKHTYHLGVQEGANAPEALFTVSRLSADFRPTSGDPKTLRVRFSVFGFALAGVAAPTVFVHYVRPDGRLQQTLRLGVAKGGCGSITRTARRRLFPFAPRSGRWKLQFDATKAYRPGTATSSFLFYAVSVNVRR